MECQPCREQGQNVSAEFWCTECEEALCENCKSLHRSFKLSRNHNVSELPTLSGDQSSNKQNELADNGKDTWRICDEHPDKYLEYFCIKHEKPCCILCKRQYHRDCCDVEKIDDVADESKIATTTVNLLSGIEKHKQILTIASNNEISHLRDLETIKVNCIEELKNTRIAINKHLDSLQNEVEQDVNKTYGNNSKELRKRVTDLSAKLEYVTDHQKRIHDTANQSNLSLGQKYLSVMHLKHLGDSFIESHENLPECNVQGITFFKLSYEKTEDSITIRIDRNLKKTNNKTDKSGENDNGMETCSSVVELEPNESDASNPALSVPFQDQANTVPEKLAHTSQMICPSSFSVTPTMHVPNTAASTKDSLFDFFLTTSFFIEKRNKDIMITDAKFMPNKYFIAMVESSNPRCMVYSKDGQKKGQVRLSGMPDSIAVINNNLVGITLIHEEKVCMVNTVKWQILKTIHVHDECKGLVYFDNNLIANCTHDGLAYIAECGKIVKKDAYIKGDLYFHIDTQGNLYSAKMDVKSIHVNNLISHKRSTFHLKGLGDPTGLTTDRENNLFVACNDSDRIFVKQSRHSPANTILDSSDGIDRPSSIDYDQGKDELLVLNNGAHSISIFKKK